MYFLGIVCYVSVYFIEYTSISQEPLLLYHTLKRLYMLNYLCFYFAKRLDPGPNYLIVPLSQPAGLPVEWFHITVRFDGRFNHWQQLTRLICLGDDVATTNQFAANEELWKRWPIRVLGQIGPNLGVRQNVHIRKLLTASYEYLSCLCRETALRLIGRTFHINDDRIAFNLLFDNFKSFHVLPRSFLNSLYNFPILL